MKFVIRRHGDGFGDWLFTLAAIKHLNEQHPDVDVFVDFELKREGRRDRFLPPIVVEAFRCSDVRWYELHENSAPADRWVDHLVYPKRGDDPYVKGMCQQLELAIGREIYYKPSTVPRFIYPEWSARPLDRGYVCMVSQGKAETRFKDWGLDKFEHLARRIVDELGVHVVQIGKKLDYKLRIEPTIDERGATFETLCGVIAGSAAFVGLENGLTVLSSMLKKLTVVAFMQQGTMVRLRDPKIAGAFKPSVDELFTCIKGHYAH